MLSTAPSVSKIFGFDWRLVCSAAISCFKAEMACGAKSVSVKLVVLMSKALARLDVASLGGGELDMVGCWTLMKLARILERGLPVESERLNLELGERPRESESSWSEDALFSKMERRLRTAEEERVCSGMAVFGGRRV